jgi:hypothetical protein
MTKRWGDRMRKVTLKMDENEKYITIKKLIVTDGNKGKKPDHALKNEIKQNILDLYRTKYEDANFVHYSELLEEHENIKSSPSTIRSILIKENIISPKANRTTRKNLVKKLKDQMEITKSNPFCTALSA